MLTLYIDPGTGSMIFGVLAGGIGALSWLLKKWKVNLHFMMNGRKPKDASKIMIPYVIFSDDKRYWPVFEPVCREFNRRGIDVLYMTISRDDPALTNNMPHIHGQFIGEGNKALAKMAFLKAGILLSTTPGLDVTHWKRSKETRYYVHMLHAPTEVTLYRMFDLDYYDALLLSGEYQKKDIRYLENIRNLPQKEIVMTGLPYLDEMKKKLKESPQVSSEGLTVLLAPSWGVSAIFSRFGGKIIDELLKMDCKVIIRPHPQSFISEKEMMDQLMAAYPESKRLSWNRDDDHFEVLKNSDILISDFSGIIFDFAMVFDKPVIYTDTEFDTSVYDAWWMDTPIWTFSALPRIGAKLTEKNLHQIGKIVKTCLKSKKFEKGRNEVRSETWAYQDEGAVRTVDFLTQKYQALIQNEREQMYEQEVLA